MHKAYLRPGYTAVTPYLTVIGAQRLLEVVQAVFDAQVLDRAEREDGHIRHATLRIGDAIVELSDATEEWKATPAALHIYVPDVERVHRKTVERGAQVLHVAERRSRAPEKQRRTSSPSRAQATEV